MKNLQPDELAEIPIFSALTGEERSEICATQMIAKYSQGQSFLLENDWGNNLFLMLSGVAKVRTFTEEGEEVVLCLLGVHEIFGEIALLDGGGRSADVVSLSDTILVKFPGMPVVKALNRNTSFAIEMARLEAKRLRDLNKRFVLQSSDAITRLLASLAYVASKFCKECDPLGEIPGLAQREVAAIAGLARETASRTLGKLKQRNIIESSSSSMRIISKEALLKRGLI